MPRRYSIPENLSWRIIEGEVVLLKIKSVTYYSLNPVGSFLWLLLEKEPKTDDEILAAVIAEFAVDAETARKDWTELRDDLLHEELLIPSEV